MKSRAYRIEKEILSQLLKIQENEITEYVVYQKLANFVRGKNRETLKKIANEEKKHHDFWRSYTQKKVSPNRLRILFYLSLAKVLGVTFAGKLMEKGEVSSQINYSSLAEKIADAEKIRKEEERHEKLILDFLDEERLRYAGSIVLGINDALVELMGALSGLTLALRNSKLIGVTGLITGVAASLSMAVSEYLSTKTERNLKNPIKASFYTGFAYILAVIVLISPYFLSTNVFLSLFLTLSFAILIILGFTFYISVAQDFDFKKRFLEMLTLSIGVSLITFLLGLFVRSFLGLEV